MCHECQYHMHVIVFSGIINITISIIIISAVFGRYYQSIP